MCQRRHTMTKTGIQVWIRRRRKLSWQSGLLCGRNNVWEKRDRQILLPYNDCYNIRGLFHILLDEIDLKVLRDSAVQVHRSTEQIEVDGEHVSQESASSIVEVLQEFFRKSSSFPQWHGRWPSGNVIQERGAMIVALKGRDPATNEAVAAN